MVDQVCSGADVPLLFFMIFLGINSSVLSRSFMNVKKNAKYLIRLETRNILNLIIFKWISDI